MLLVIVFTLYLTNHWPFGKQEQNHQILMESTSILREIENLGRLELVRYNFNEVFEYKKLSNGKIVGNALLKSTDYDPDISVILVATGEAVGCIDLTKINIADVKLNQDTLVLHLPTPELCYYKLDLDKTRIYSFSNESWWARMFSNNDEKNGVLQMAYREAENKLREAALESGIFHSTNENVTIMLVPLLTKLSGKKVKLVTKLPNVELEPDL